MIREYLAESGRRDSHLHFVGLPLTEIQLNESVLRDSHLRFVGLPLTAQKPKIFKKLNNI